MKKNILSILFSALVCGMVSFHFASCDDNNTEIKETTGTTIFEVEPITFEGIAEGQEAEIHFTAGASWTATFTSSNNWLSASPTQGKAGEATILITPYGDNRSSNPRSAELMVLVDGEDLPFLVRITQLSAAESDLEITGDIEDGVMNLKADNTGGKFVGNLQITSSSKWNISAENTNNWLSFSKDKEPQDGKETTVNLTINADYQNFTDTSMSGSFSLYVPGTSPVVIQVKAVSECHVFEHDSKRENDEERVSYELTDTLQIGTYQTTFYVESNIMWEVKDMPEWIQLANETSQATNRKDDGTLQTHRVGVGLMLKEEYLSAERREGTIQLTDIRGEVLKSIEITFDGIQGNFLQHDFAFPSYDPLGNDFSFEAKSSYIDAENKNDYWKKMELPFNIKTSIDYTSINDAPYHLIMCNANNGRVLKQEVHWASLRMGDASKRSETNGIFTKEIYLKANDRGDEDDQNGLTNPAAVREAFIFIVPKNVTFDDLFNPGDATLKEEYAESFSHIMQKQDHEITYEFILEGLDNGGTVYLPSDGGTCQFKVTKVTSEQLTPELIRLWYNQSTGEWEEKEASSAQQNGVILEYLRSEETGDLESVILNVSPGMLTTTRGFRFNINVFRGDGYSETQIFTFDIKLKENE